mmetsp:Transcript_13009/g.22260  ORF Transcript_13009/g.22260 Transcript_13009/m.22260 type:complete len:94 (+) Transcript_13009:176-457(+)
MLLPESSQSSDHLKVKITVTSSVGTIKLPLVSLTKETTKGILVELLGSLPDVSTQLLESTEVFDTQESALQSLLYPICISASWSNKYWSSVTS